MTESIALKELSKLNLIDKFLFDETMEYKDAYEATVSILLEEDITISNKPESEKELRVSSELRQIRLDVISVDDLGRNIYTEMQKENTYNLKKRSRYYQGHVDVSLLEPGIVNFNKLNDVCMIMVTPFDIFGKGLCRYSFENTCNEIPNLKLEDGAKRVFINTKGTNRDDYSQEFLDFIDYINDTTDERAAQTSSERIKKIHSHVKNIRLSETMGVKKMQRWEELVYAEQKGKTETILALVSDSTLSPQRGAEMLDISIDKLYELANQYNIEMPTTPQI